MVSMLVTEQWMRENYDRFNTELFGGRLPSNISFKTSNRNRPWGFAGYQYSHSTGKLVPIGITISNYYDSDEWVKQNILIHEMIHIEDYTEHPEHFLKFSHRTWRYEVDRQYDAHGEVFFLPEARRMKQYGWDIEKYVTEEEQSASRVSDRISSIQNKKKAAGVTFYIIRYKEPYHGKHGIDYYYGYCKVTNANEDHYVHMFRQGVVSGELLGVDKYISHSQAAVEQSTNRGGSWYLTNDIEKYINRFELEYVSNLCGETDRTQVNSSKSEPVNIHTDNQSRQLEIPFESDKISLFRMPLKGGGALELKNISKEEIAQAIKEKFPNFSEEVVKKIVDNANFYPNKDNTMKESKIRHTVDEAMNAVMGYNMDNDPMVSIRELSDEVEEVSIV